MVCWDCQSSPQTGVQGGQQGEECTMTGQAPSHAAWAGCLEGRETAAEAGAPAAQQDSSLHCADC
jgi:hypothetical protein